jgi:hypothetical protein
MAALGLAHVAAFTCAPGNDAVTCAALGDLYSATGGSWFQTAGWANASADVPTDFCTFYGVYCADGTTVTSLCVLGACIACYVWPGDARLR